MLSARRHGWSLFGRLFCSARYCKAQAYATIFSLGISQMSWLAKMDMTGGMNLCQWRHGGAGRTWNGASLGSSSCICLGSWNEALTSQASPPVSSSGTVDNSAHQSGISHFLALHHTHLADLDTDGSGSISSSLPSNILDDPCKKEATSTLSCGGSPKSKSLPLDPIPPGGISGLADWLAVGWLEKLTWHHLFFLLSSSLWLSLCLHLGLEQTFIRCNFSISSSRVTAVDKAFWCTSHTLVRLLSSKLFLSHWGGLLWGGWKSSGLGCLQVSGVPSSSSEWQGRADDTSFKMAGSPGGELGNLCSL